MGRRRATTVSGVLLVILLAAVSGAVAYLSVWDQRSHRAATTPVTAGPTPSAVASATASPPAPAAVTGAAASASGVASALGTALADPALGGRVLASVVDVASGAVLFDRGATTDGRPASTAKIVTATAVLATHAATDRITTRVVAGSRPGQIVLVGGGDPTLSAAPAGSPTPYPGAARLSDLAAAVRRTGLVATQLVVDDSLFSGPAVSPDWDAGDVPTSYASAVTALMADGGRDTPTTVVRSADPAVSAAAAFAADLGITEVTTGSAPPGARTIAAVASAPYSTLVAQMLQQSDDVIADCLARQVALAAGQPASFTGGAAASRAVLQKLGVDIGPHLVDGSGLAEQADQLDPAAIAGLLRLDALGSDPALRYVLAGLPVAGWDGSLATRYRTGSTAAGAGAVRAKTGTLSGVGAVPGVSALAGVVHDRSGRLLAFSVIADQLGAGSGATDQAAAALDGVATALVGCGCG